MRRGAVGGFVGGLLALTLLEAFLTGSQSRNVGGLLAGVGDLARRWSDPTVPAIPDLRTSSSATTSTTTSTSTTSTPRLPPTVTV